jgi:hypothetical protein
MRELAKATSNVPTSQNRAHARRPARRDGLQRDMSDTETGTPEKKPAKKDRHLYQIDFVRLVTFAGVILDHVILGMAPYTAIIAQGAGLILRYTRYCFFALTGFVLTYQYRNRDLHAPTFWRRRFKLIGLPFLVWSLFYWLNKHYQKGGLENVFAIFDDSHTIRSLSSASTSRHSSRTRRSAHCGDTCRSQSCRTSSSSSPAASPPTTSKHSPAS